MIENHLYCQVTDVNAKLLPCLLAITLTGCDRTEVTLSFTPEMASFSNEFDFDPLRGPVKDFTQTLINEQGEVTKRVSGTLSEEASTFTGEMSVSGITFRRGELGNR